MQFQTYLSDCEFPDWRERGNGLWSSASRLAARVLHVETIPPASSPPPQSSTREARESALGRHARLLVALVLSLPAACASSDGSSATDEPGQSQGALTLRVFDARGVGVPQFVATITDDLGQSQTFACREGAEEESGSDCRENELSLLGVSGDLRATVKARGYAFWQGEVPAEGLEGSERVHEVMLEELKPFEHTEDYDTGYESEQDLTRFEAAAVTEGSELGEMQIVKFYIADLQTEPTVYFQNTQKHPLHFTFARDVLKQAVTTTEFEAATYQGAERTAMAGTIVRRPRVRAQSDALGGTLEAPVSVTFFPSDDLTPTQALLAHRLIEERMGFAALDGASARVVYEPAGSLKEEELQDDSHAFQEWGSLWLRRGEIYGSLEVQPMNEGEAYGTLRRMTPEELETAVVSYRDILVLTRLPMELPIVGGTITEEMQTPLAHVNIAARTRGTPNLALKNASSDPRVKDLFGKLVHFEVKNGEFKLTAASEEDAEAYWAAQTHESRVPEFDDTSEGLFSFESIGFTDSLRVGVKAANLAELSQLLGDKAPRGFAVPFFYYDQFMRGSFVSEELCEAARLDCESEGRATETCQEAYDLCLPAGEGAESLRSYVERLLANESFRLSSSLREALLDGVKYLMRNIEVEPSFAALLDARVTEQFGASKVRIRSSTNSEDLDDFSGAGLYDSVSANTPEQGAPSTEIRKVWASVWNWRAFEERSFWNIDHLAVRVGCAITQAFPDEAANGVLITQNVVDFSVAGMYVNVQLGETSVTNPTDGALPEAFSILPAPAGIQVLRQRYSSLSNDVAILSDAEVRELYDTCWRVQDHFAPLYDEDPFNLALDIEFKFNQPDRTLIIKQVRPYTGQW